jgi:hypothetical protein
MKETNINLESAGRGFAEWVHRARREHTAFVVLDATSPVAKLIPTDDLICTGAELAKALGNTCLTSPEARAWANDLSQSRTALSQPKDKWQ